MSTAEHERIIQHKLKQTFSCLDAKALSTTVDQVKAISLRDCLVVESRMSMGSSSSIIIAESTRQVDMRTPTCERDRKRRRDLFAFHLFPAFVYVLKLIFKASNSASSHIASAVGESLRKLSESANCSVEFKTRKRIFSEDDACNKPITNFELNVKALEHQWR